MIKDYTIKGIIIIQLGIACILPLLIGTREGLLFLMYVLCDFVIDYKYGDLLNARSERNRQRNNNE